MERIIMGYMDNLTVMGYSLEWREKVLKAAMVGYQRILFQVRQGTTRRNRMGGTPSRIGGS